MSDATRFVAMRGALRDAGQTQPVVVIDLPRLLDNLERVGSGLPPEMCLRLVAKSLPSPELLQVCCERLGTQRLMTFNLPMLEAIARQMPQADQLLGKPFPVSAAAAFLSAHADIGQRVHWLIDTPERLRQYSDLVKGLGVNLQIALELDVGLHRGGFTPGPSLRDALAHIAATPALSLSTVVGYEAHVSKVPALLGWRRQLFARGLAQYRAALRQIGAVLGESVVASLIRNAGGSPTFRLYQDLAVANELAIGSVLVKPSDFDTDLLTDFESAAYIATPALKLLRPIRTPALEWLDAPRRLLGRRNAVCIHGGYWKARPVDPPGLRYDSSFGRSSNQEVLVSRRGPEIAPDDFVFLRPTQSEVVLGQLGKIAVFDGTRISDFWSVFPPAG